MDGINVGQEIMTTLGIPSEPESATEEKVGEERLGDSNLLASFGATLILFSILFGLLLLIVIAVIFIVRRVKTSPKCRERVKKIKRSVFFNPIIRYMILNSLKLNMSALLAVKAASDGKVN